MTGHPALEISDLSVAFRHDNNMEVRALVDVSVRVPDGQLLVLIGPSGHGKSTLLSVAAGLLTPTSGTVLAHGRPVTGPSPERGIVFQQDTTFPWMRVRDHVGYGPRLRGVPARERRLIADKFLKSVGLESFAGSWPKELSGGMRKRLAVATAFAANPSVLFMDEPFGSLDFVTRTILHAMLLKLWKETNMTIVFVTHDVDEALLLGDRICVLVAGRIVDDIVVQFERPRGDDLRSNPRAIDLRRHLLGRLGIEALSKGV